MAARWRSRRDRILSGGERGGQNEDQVVQLDPGWQVDPSVPDPMLVQREDLAALIFHTAPDRRRVLVVFEDCLISRFGYPNDEGLGGHPLYAKGLTSYAFGEVVNSSWSSTLEEESLPTSTVMGKERHFIITFHDSMFECLAHEMRWEWVTGSTLDAFRSLLTSTPTTRQ
jgi:hypothetical protein